MQILSEANQAKSSIFYNTHHWLSFIANGKYVWINKAYNAYAGVLPQANLQSNSIFYRIETQLKEDEEIISTGGGLFNFYYLTNQNRIFKISRHDELPKVIDLNLDANEKITQIIIKETATIIVTDKPGLYVSGQNKVGELGLPKLCNLLNLSKVELALAEDETIEKFVISDKDKLILNQGIIGYHSAFFTNKNRFFVAGSNSYKQLGLTESGPITTFKEYTLEKFDSIKDIAVTSRATFVLTQNGKLWISGNYLFAGKRSENYTHTFRQISLPKLNHDDCYMKLECGDEHCFLLTKNGEVWVSGKNNFGELGLSHTREQVGFVKAKLNLPIDEKIIKISCMNHQSILETNAKRLLFSGRFYDFCNPTQKKQTSSFTGIFYPEQHYLTQYRFSQLLLALSISSFVGSFFTQQIWHTLLLGVGTSFLLLAFCIHLLSKYNAIMHTCEQNQHREITQHLGLKF